MDVTGLILLLGLLLLAGGVYVAMFRNKIAKKPTSPETIEKQEVYQEEQAKFETSIEFFPDIVFPPDPVKEHVPDLPRNYNDTNITVMARDPETVYSYWEVSEERKTHLKETYGSKWDNSTPVVRLYDVTGVEDFDGNNANNFKDVAINDHADSWYAHTGTPDRIYCADLGRKLNDDTFVMIARSNYTYTPRNTLSDRVDPKWMMVSLDQKKLYDRIGNVDGVSSFELFDRN